MPVGSIVNATTVILGSVVGLLVRQALPERIKRIIFQAVGLATLVLGMQMALGDGVNFLILIFSLILGGILGESVQLSARMDALNEGLTGDRTLIFSKSILDGFTSMVLASVYGVGVLFSALPLFVVQSSLTLIGAQFHTLFPEALIVQLTAVGGALILGIGVELLEIKKLQTVNLLPALLVVIVLTGLFLL